MPLVKSITSDTVIFQIDEIDIQTAVQGRASVRKDRISGGYLGQDPIAIALSKIGKYRGVYVGWRSISAYKGPIRHDYMIVNFEEVSDLVRMFDRHEEPLPLITVELFFEKEVQTGDRFTQKKIKPREKLMISKGGKIVP